MTEGNGKMDGLEGIVEISQREFEEELDEAILSLAEQYSTLSKMERKYERDIYKYHLKYYKDTINNVILYIKEKEKRIGF